MSAGLFYRLGFWVQKNDKYAKNMNTEKENKQTITDNKATGQRLSHLPHNSVGEPTTSWSARGLRASSSSFAAAKTVKCFFFRYCHPSAVVHLIEFDGFTLIRAAAAPSLPSSTSAHESGHDFYCLSYNIVLAVAYALNI